MGEHGVDAPLWHDGLLFSDAAEMARELDLSSDLEAHIEAWGLAWEAQSGLPAHDAEAARLVRRLKQELGHRYQVIYHP
jgi:hypothetical protein